MRLLLSWPWLLLRGFVSFEQLELRRSGAVQIRRVSRQKVRPQAAKLKKAMKSAAVLAVLLITFAGIETNELLTANRANPDTAGSEPVETSSEPATAAAQLPDNCTRITRGAKFTRAEADLIFTMSASYGGLVVSESDDACKSVTTVLLRVSDEGYVVEKVIPQPK
jgi:hypothetical protein